MTTIDYNSILQRLHKNYDFGGANGSVTDLHAIHFCRVFERLVRANYGPSDREGIHALDVVGEGLVQCLAQLKNTHLDWGVELTESDVFPVLRVLTLAEYLDAPHEPGEVKWEDLIAVSKGDYDEVLAKGNLPGHLNSQMKTAWNTWKREENGNDSII